MVTKNTLPIQFDRNYAEAPFDGMIFTTTTALNDYLTNPTRYAGQIVALVETGPPAAVTLYVLNTDRTAWEPVGGGAGGGVLQNDINVLDVNIGSYESGDTIPAGTDIEAVLNGILTKVIPPTYDAPTLSLAGSGAKQVEAGTSINPVLTPTFTQNDGGAQNDYNLDKDTINIYNNTSAAPYADGPFTIGDGSVVYDADVSYDQGPVKNDNTGTPDPTGQIPAGTVNSNTVSYTGLRKLFYDIDGDIVNIRNNTNFVLGPSGTTSFSITGSGNNLVFAYPDTIADFDNVELVSSGFTFDITGDVAREADQLVNDASGANPINYKVFRYQPASPFTNATFNVQL